MTDSDTGIQPSWWGNRWSLERHAPNYPSPELVEYLERNPDHYFEERFIVRAVQSGLLPADIHTRFWLAAQVDQPFTDEHILQTVGLSDSQPHPLIEGEIELPSIV